MSDEDLSELSIARLKKHSARIAMELEVNEGVLVSIGNHLRELRAAYYRVLAGTHNDAARCALDWLDIALRAHAVALAGAQAAPDKLRQAAARL